MRNEYIKLKQDGCKNCFRCIRDCPVKSISFADHQARILDTECILCGRCFVVCPQKAKEILNDTDKAKAFLASGDPVYASIAPSFTAYFDGAGIAALEAALLALGFAGVGETALGATIVKKRYDEIVASGEQQIIISSCCHSVVLLLQKHYPEALPWLAPVLSPMQAHCLDIKERNPKAKTVFIGPCISKKAEADAYPGLVDCVLTFAELAEWLLAEHISLPDIPDEQPGGKARLFPISGGILRSMEKPDKNYAYLSIEGVQNCIAAVEDLLSGQLEPCFIEMSMCRGSCIGGPIMEIERPPLVKSPVSSYIAIDRYAGKDDFSVDMPSPEVLRKDFTSAALPKIAIAESAILETLRKTGKTKPEDELNCGTCGYHSCRDKAKAVLQGKAELSMCLPFLKEKAESFSDTILKNTPNGVIVLNESLEIQQINEAACRILNVRDAADLIGNKVVRVLDPDIFVEAISTGHDIYNRSIYLAEYGRYVRHTIVRDQNYHIFIVIMRDVTEEETAREQNDALNRQTAEITDQVIEKQMRVVQEIAYLLGETAAETKIALSKLKESLRLE